MHFVKEKNSFKNQRFFSAKSAWYLIGLPRSPWPRRRVGCVDKSSGREETSELMGRVPRLAQL